MCNNNGFTFIRMVNIVDRLYYLLYQSLKNRLSTCSQVTVITWVEDETVQCDVTKGYVYTAFKRYLKKKYLFGNRRSKVIQSEMKFEISFSYFLDPSFLSTKSKVFFHFNSFYLHTKYTINIISILITIVSAAIKY